MTFFFTSSLANFESEVREISPFFFFSVKPRFKQKTQELTTKADWRSCSNTFFFRFQVKIGEQFFKSAFVPPGLFQEAFRFQTKISRIYLSQADSAGCPGFIRTTEATKFAEDCGDLRYYTPRGDDTQVACRECFVLE